MFTWSVTWGTNRCAMHCEQIYITQYRSEQLVVLAC